MSFEWYSAVQSERRVRGAPEEEQDGEVVMLRCVVFVGDCSWWSLWLWLWLGAAAAWVADRRRASGELSAQSASQARRCRLRPEFGLALVECGVSRVVDDCCSDSTGVCDCFCRWNV